MSNYPHTDQSAIDVHPRPTVYFLGTQSLYELVFESALNQEQPIPHDSANAGETIIDTSNFKYSFNSQKGSQLIRSCTLYPITDNVQTDYKKFREDVWGKELVKCTRAKISTPAVETTSEVLTL